MSHGNRQCDRPAPIADDEGAAAPAMRAATRSSRMRPYCSERRRARWKEKKCRGESADGCIAVTKLHDGGDGDAVAAAAPLVVCCDKDHDDGGAVGSGHVMFARKARSGVRRAGAAGMAPAKLWERNATKESWPCCRCCSWSGWPLRAKTDCTSLLVMLM